MDAKKIVLVNLNAAKTAPTSGAAKIKIIADIQNDLAEVVSVSTTATTSTFSTLAAANILAPVGTTKLPMVSQVALTTANNTLGATLPAGVSFPVGSYVMVHNVNDAGKALRQYAEVLQVVKQTGTALTFGAFLPDGLTASGAKADLTCVGMSIGTEHAVPFRLLGKSGTTVQLALSISTVPYLLSGSDRLEITLAGDSSILTNNFPIQQISQRRSFSITNVADDGTVTISDPENMINGSAKVLPSERAVISFGLKNVDVRYPGASFLILNGATENDVYTIEMFC
ncbi:MAG: hypothetical protein ACRCX2_04810 [Paraclostridium sp.]